MLDLHKDAQNFEQGFFYLQAAPELVSKATAFGFRRTVWKMTKRDGSDGYFTSIWFFNRIQFYSGDCKCDGTRTRMYWAGQLDDGAGFPYAPDPTQYVYTDLPKELSALRWRSNGPGETSWDNMGGS